MGGNVKAFTRFDSSLLNTEKQVSLMATAYSATPYCQKVLSSTYVFPVFLPTSLTLPTILLWLWPVPTGKTAKLEDIL